MNEAPIGFFDSGLGGLTIRREVMRLLPGENTVYLADSAQAPYGAKSPSEIIDLSRRNTRWLLDQGSKLIVVACNTATTNAIRILRSEFPVPFVGIEPAIKPAALQTKSQRIGVLATRGTLSSSLFASTSKLYASGIEVVEQEGRGLVRMIESGKLEDPETTARLRELLSPMLEAGIDHLVLGCTHYPLLVPQLEQVLPEHVKIVDCSPAIARQTEALLAEHGLSREGGGAPVHRVVTTGDLKIASHMLRSLGHPERPEELTF